MDNAPKTCRNWGCLKRGGGEEGGTEVSGEKTKLT